GTFGGKAVSGSFHVSASGSFSGRLNHLLFTGAYRGAATGVAGNQHGTVSVSGQFTALIDVAGGTGAVGIFGVTLGTRSLPGSVHGVCNVVSMTVAAPNTKPSPPIDVDAGANTVAAGAAAGTTVGVTASASDPDGGTVTYQLTDDAGGRFVFDPSTSIVTVAAGANIQASDGSY